MIPIPLVRYRFECHTLRDIVFNGFTGSDLRSVFGASLRKLTCVTGKTQCEGCAVQVSCPYGLLFSNKTDRTVQSGSNQTMLNPYVIEPPEWGTQGFTAGEIWSFQLTLIGGGAETLLLLVILAWQRALEQGLGSKSAGRARLLRVLHCQADGDETVIFDPSEKLIKPHDRILNLCSDGESSVEVVRLYLRTPMRLQYKGHVLTPRSVKPRDLIEVLMRRVRLFFPQQFHLLFNMEEISNSTWLDTIKADAELEFCDWKRYSASQHQEMSLGGLMGQWTWTGHLHPLLMLLKLGAWLHVGKNTTFGMGHYTMEYK